MSMLIGVTLLLLPIDVRAADDGHPASPDHWSLRAVQRPVVPRFERADQRAWIRTPIDAFILDRLSGEGLSPVREANRRTLIRRVTFALTGLPPTPPEIDAFVNDPAPDAYEDLVDRLLASPRYGERWGRHWLDVIRFAETEGFEYDRHRAGAWRFRDYLIDSFNTDKPYDRFVREQLSGDEIDPHNHDLLVAAGFQRLGPVRRNAGNQALAFSRNEVLTEMTDVVGTTFLGLTVGCARCHDHMFDDIPQADYYRLQAFFAAAQEYDLPLVSPEEASAWKAKTEQIQAEIKVLKESVSSASGTTRDELEAKLRELEQSLPPPLPTISSVRDDETTLEPVHVLTRGNPDTKQEQVGPRTLSLLLATDVPELAPDTPHPRTILADWITSRSNPLTARVFVNRLWQYHFGRGLVATANDFGVNGSPPTHPELLDWLADEFVSSGWQIKRLQRLIVLSATYRQCVREQSGESREQWTALLCSYPRQRLSAEELRDAMLAISGRLNEAMQGPSVVVPVDQDLVNLLYAPTQWSVTPDAAEHERRSVYLIAKRNLRLPFMEVFDQPDAQTSCARREASTHALQALELLNGDLSNQLAQSFAARLRHEAGDDPAAQVTRAFLLAAGRSPTEREQELGVAFLQHQPLEEFALAVFNLNAFLYVD